MSVVRYTKDGLSLFQRREVHIVGPDNNINFDYKYVEAKRGDVLRKAIERASLVFDEAATQKHLQENKLRETPPIYRTVSENELKAYIVEAGREVGYMTMIRDGETPFYETLASEEVSLENLKLLFKKEA